MKNKYSYEDFMKLMQQAIDSFNKTDEIDNLPDETIEMEDVYVPPPITEHKPNTIGSIDLTKYKKDKIRDALLKCANLRVGNFTVIISRYYGMPKDEAGMSMNIRIMEDKTKTPTGNPCRMTYDIDVFKDTRFKDRAWRSYFKSGSSGYNIPEQTVVEVIRWLQALTKLAAFL